VQNRFTIILAVVISVVVLFLNLLPFDKRWDFCRGFYTVEIRASGGIRTRDLDLFEFASYQGRAKAISSFR